MSELPHTLQAREAEAALTGAVLFSPEVLAELPDALTSADFADPSLASLWRVFEKLHVAGRPIDFVTVSHALREAGKLEEIGGDAFLAGLLNATPTSLNAAEHAALVRAASIRRRIFSASQQVARLACDATLDLDEACAQSLGALEKSVERQLGAGLLPMHEAVSQAYERIYAFSKLAELPGISTGMKDLDSRLGKLQPGTLTVLAARPGQGKTSLLLEIARRAALRGARVVFFSLEMPLQALMARLLAQQSGLDSQRVSFGQLDEKEWQRLNSAVAEIGGLPLHLDCSSELNPAQLRARCARLRLQHGGPDLVLVDYLQLMNSARKFETREQEVGMVSRALKSLSLQLDAPVLVAAQLNRSLEKRSDSRSILSDLRESGRIENDADTVMFLQRDEAGMTRVPGAMVMKLIVAKNRNGPVGDVDMLYYPAATHFETAGKERPQPETGIQLPLTGVTKNAQPAA